MRPSNRALCALAYGVCVLLLLVPALWNGFPLLNHDSGGYLARWYEGSLEANRATVYGLILSATVPLAFWPVLLLQAAVGAWIIALVLRTQELGQRPMQLVATVATLTIVTALPWLTSLLLTDVLCGLSVLALYLLLMRSESLGRGERFGLILVIAVSTASHSATLAVLLSLIAAVALPSLFDRKRLPLVRLGHSLFAIALGAVLTLGANAIVVKRLTWTPGIWSFPFGRMLQDGIVKLYLDEHCPNPKLRLCAYKDQLPDDGDVWFWDSPLFDRLGRFAGLGREMETIAIDSVIEYPALQAKTVLAAAGNQLVEVASGEGIINAIWHTYGIIEHFTPQLVPSMRGARQQKHGIDFNAINRLHVPAALIAIGLLPLIALLAWRSRIPYDVGELAAFCTLALLANAFICGVLSNPHDRYGARIAWIAVLTLVIAVARGWPAVKNANSPAAH